jgi:hypothetical protein
VCCCRHCRSSVHWRYRCAARGHICELCMTHKNQNYFGGSLHRLLVLAYTWPTNQPTIRGRCGPLPEDVWRTMLYGVSHLATRWKLTLLYRTYVRYISKFLIFSFDSPTHFYLWLTNSTKQSPSWEADSFPRVMWPCSPDPIKSQINPSNLFKTLFNVILPSTTWPYKSTLSSTFPPQNRQCISLPPPPNYTFYLGHQTLLHQYQCYTLFNASKAGYCWLSSCNNFWHFLCSRCPTQRTDMLWY